MTNQTTPHGLRSFFIIWIGQLISLVGSQLTGFALHNEPELTHYSLNGGNPDLRAEWQSIQTSPTQNYVGASFIQQLTPGWWYRRTAPMVVNGSISASPPTDERVDGMNSNAISEIVAMNVNNPERPVSHFYTSPGKASGPWGKGGIVKDYAMYAIVEQRLRETCAELGLTVTAWLDSPIEGGDGNREFFICATKA